MTKQTYFYTTAGIFLAVGVLHLVRAINAWDLVIADTFIPVWVSWAVAIIAGLLAYRGYHFGKRL